MPYPKIKADLYKVDTLLITHAHSDHVKPATLRHIRKEFPRIRVYANADVAYRYPVDVVVGTTPFMLPHGRYVIPFDGVHDVPVTGYIVKLPDLTTYLYMTDTSVVELPQEIPLDYLFLESNYDQDKLRRLAGQYKRPGYDPTLAARRHLSTQACLAAYYCYRRGPESKLVELHQSHRFY